LTFFWWLAVAVAVGQRMSPQEMAAAVEVLVVYFLVVELQ
jgi:hypothetical protein